MMALTISSSSAGVKKSSTCDISVEFEVYLRNIFGSRIGAEQGQGVKIGQRGNDIGWNLLDLDIVLCRQFIEAVALHIDPVLGTLQLGLQFQEVLVGLELRIAFHGHQQSGEGG